MKFVIADEGDWLYAKSVIKRHDLETRTKAILISPAWGQVDLQQLADWVAEKWTERPHAVATAQVHLGTGR